MGNFTYQCKQHFSFTLQEALHALITSVIAGFAISFNNWGAETVNISKGVSNLILGILFVYFALTIQIVAIKLAGIWKGYVIDYNMWKLGLLFSVLITVLTNGTVPLFFTGNVAGEAKEKIRVGVYMPRFKHWEFGLANFAGPIANLLIVLALQPLYIATGSALLYYFLTSVLLTMMFSLLPIPLFHGVKVIEEGRTEYDWEGSTIGFNIFIMNRFLYVFFFASMLAYTLLALLTKYFSFILSILVGVVITAVWYVSFESE